MRAFGDALEAVEQTKDAEQRIEEASQSGDFDAMQEALEQLERYQDRAEDSTSGKYEKRLRDVAEEIGLWGESGEVLDWKVRKSRSHPGLNGRLE